MSLEIEVVADWIGMARPITMGTLRISRVRGKETFAFAFHREWLESCNHPFLLDPELQWVQGDQFSGEGFGIFLDSAPDRWGRTLIARREARAAREEGRSPRTLMDSDYLLAVEDETRMGGPGLRTGEGGGTSSDRGPGGAILETRPHLFGSTVRSEGGATHPVCVRDDLARVL